MIFQIRSILFECFMREGESKFKEKEGVTKIRGIKVSGRSEC